MTKSRKIDESSLAIDRTMLANERTYQAWLRTGLATAAAGLGIFKLLEGVIPLWILVIIATLLMLSSAAFFWMAAWRYSHVHLRTAHLDIEAMSPNIAKIFALILAFCSVLALAGLIAESLY